MEILSILYDTQVQFLPLGEGEGDVPRFKNNVAGLIQPCRIDGQGAIEESALLGSRFFEMLTMAV